VDYWGFLRQALSILLGVKPVEFTRSNFLLLRVLLLSLLLLVGVNSFAEKPDRNKISETEYLTQANNEFGFALFENLALDEAGENVFISPLSIHLALNMTYMGSESETGTEMAKVLGLSGLTKKEVAELARELLTKTDELPDVKISIANSIWARKGLPFKKSFLKTGENYFQARIEELGFGSPDALKTINRWVKENTNGKIEKIVKKLNPLDVMVLLNAIYFEGPWKNQFEEENTREMPFHLLEGAKKQIPMMIRSGNFSYFENDKFQLIRLPYGKKEPMAAYIVLPREEQGLNELIKTVDPRAWENWISSMKRVYGRFGLPRFILRYEEKLNAALKDMGMQLSFNEEEADFSGIIDIPNQNAFISEVRHKTFLEVTERGTKAAAATSVKMRLTSLAPEEEEFEMIVDRPFLFAIRYEESGELLFLGGVRNPGRIREK